jgi:general secretion pathway protein G
VLRLLRFVALFILTIGMLVCGCLSILYSFGDPVRDPDRLRHSLATRQIRTFVHAIERFRNDCGDFPSGEIGLDALLRDPGLRCWRGPYLDGAVPLDPWHHKYVYRYASDGASPEIMSYGADGSPGGRYFDADISSLSLNDFVAASPREVEIHHEILAKFWLAVIGFFACPLLRWALVRHPIRSPR